MRFDEHFLNGTLSNFSFLEKKFPDQISFSIDSRTIKEGEIFVAIEGNKFDAHSAIEDVLKSGAAGVFLNSSKKSIFDKIDKKLYKNKLIVCVEDTVEALLQMAKAWRARFEYPVVAITGSVGKTSTKETVSNILKASLIDHIASFGNQNTKIGVSLNIFRMRENHRAAIFELGISKRGDMEALVEILRPTTALITCIGHSHMEGLGSLSDIASEKRQVFKYFADDSIGIVNGDQQILAEVGYVHPVIKFGTKTTNQIQARKVRVDGNSINFVIKIYNQKYDVSLQNPHSGAVNNALAAAAIANLLGVSGENIVNGLKMPVAVASRFEERKIVNNRGMLISDCYNASPESMKAALIAMDKIDTRSKKIAVLGDMLELGVNSPFWHRQLGRVLRKTTTIRHVLLVGEMVAWTKKTLPVTVEVEHVKSSLEAIERLEKMIDKDSLVLVKGSNGMNLISLVNAYSEKGNSGLVSSEGNANIIEKTASRSASV